MAAGLGFKTFTTGEVLTAADTNGYLMQGVLVFTNAAARDAAITAPQEGQTCYLKSTDAVMTYSGSTWVAVGGGSSPLTTKGDLYTFSTVDARLPVGTNGQVLIADSNEATGLKFATPAGGGALVFINSATGTTANEIAVDSAFSATYENYIVIYTGVASAGCELRANFRASATNNTDANYESAVVFNNAPTTVAADASESQTKFRRFGSASADNTSTQWFIGSPFASKKTSYTSINVDMETPKVRIAAGGFKASTSFTGISIADNDVTATLTGTLRVYGVANS